GKAPSGLSLPESLVLAALLPSPTAPPRVIAARACARAQSRKLDVNCSALRDTAAAMLGADVSIADPRSAPHTAGATVARVAVSSDREAPRLAPQLARTLLTRPGERVRTTLDANVQKLATGVLREHLSQLTARNVRDGAVLVVDNVSGDVLAYVASSGPTSRARNV